MSGYAGKILRIDLTKRTIKVMPTKDYKKWVGGHGMGSAIFYDIVVREKKLDLEKIDGFDPANVITLMTSPVSGTLVPSAPGRTEVQAIGVQSYPVGWYTRTNFGGRFSAMLKYAQWDGIVIEGASDTPVWIDIRDGNVAIRDCSTLSLWGMDIFKCQQAIWDYVAKGGYGDWIDAGERKSQGGGQTTQMPAVLAIAPTGENLCRTAALVHDAGSAAGQGGFGAVWGSKKLKAISVVGTGSVKIADPNALMKARLWAKNIYGTDLKNPRSQYFRAHPKMWTWFGSAPTGEGERPQACLGCISGCRMRFKSGLGNESVCMARGAYMPFDMAKHGGRPTEVTQIASDLLQKYGVNAYELLEGLNYYRDLYEMGSLGKGKEIDCGDLDFEDIGSVDFVDKFIRIMAYRTGDFGDAIAEGAVRAAKRWGRLEEDLSAGLLHYPYWGLPEHGYDSRAELEWGYGTLLGDRDINEHCLNGLYWWPSVSKMLGQEPEFTAEYVTKVFTDKMVPYEGDQLMLDYSTENMYSEHIVKLVAWHRHYTRFWKGSVLFCDWRWPDLFNANAPDGKGMSPDGEPKFLNAVTGGNLSFAQGMEMGRKIWNLDHAIWTLQGRHRDMVKFADYIYEVPCGSHYLPIEYFPGRKNGKWDWISISGETGRYIDREKFEDWKTRFYKFEGWDPSTGYPAKKTLEDLGLGYVAAELEKRNKLGALG
jgi:aldehyde:ferredoxin oxidoreductase